MISIRYFSYKRRVILPLIFSIFFSPHDLFAQSSLPEKNNTPEVELEVENDFRSDRFLFRGDNIDDLLLILLIYERGKKKEGYYAEFFGAMFTNNTWSFLEGSDKHPLLLADLEEIQGSYFSTVTGTATSGYILSYDAGDTTFKLSSAPVHKFHTSDQGFNLKKDIGIAEAFVTFGGKKYWGDLIHESLVWKGFDGIKQYKNLYKNYTGFYLKTEKGRQIYFHQNKADRKKFLKEYQFTETLQSESGIIQSGNPPPYLLTPPISLNILKDRTPPFALYRIPERWQLDLQPDFGPFFLWSRSEISKHWVTGGYYLMAIEGILKRDGEEERVWGLAEFFP